jgi:hypothetical protein
LSDVTFVSWKDKSKGSLSHMKAVASPHAFSVGPEGAQQMITAAENVEVKTDRTVHVRVRQVDIPEKSLVLPSFWIRHPLGNMAGAMEIGVPGDLGKKRVISEIVFHPVADGMIQVNDLLGVINILYASPEFKLHEEEVAEYIKDRYWFG